MFRNWEEFALGPKDAREEMHVTLNQHGEIMIGAGTARRFGPHNWAVLLYDRWNGLIGIAPTNERSENAFPIVNKVKGQHRVIRGFAGITEYSCRERRHAKPNLTTARWYSI